MEDYSQRIPDLLEAATDKIRSLTVDRVARIIKIAALGLVMALLVLVALIFLIVGLSRIVEELIAKTCSDPACSWPMQAAYAAVGGLFLLFGALIWSARTKKPRPEEPRT